MDRDADYEARRARRQATMQVRKTTLDDSAGQNGLWGPTTAAQRLAILDDLTRTCWALGRKPVPDYPRSEMPVRMYRRRQKSFATR